MKEILSLVARIASSTFVSPALHEVRVSFHACDRPAAEQPSRAIRTAHIVTPESATSTHYFIHHARNFALEDSAITAFMHEQLLAEVMKPYAGAELVWCQDEPQNQGAWFFIQHNIHENMLDGQKLGYAGRAASASPAVGYSHLHQEQQKALVDAAFAKLKGFVLTK